MIPLLEQVVGFLAAGLVLATFCMRTMLPLRVVAITSNLAFIAYSASAHLTPILALHTVLLPINCLRLAQVLRLARELKASLNESLSIHPLIDFMRRRELRTGQVLVRKGDPAGSMFYLAEGELEVPEVGARCVVGQIVGEVGVFAPSQARSATVVAARDCVLYEIDAARVRELFFQHPHFGYYLLRLISTRFVENLSTKRVTATARADPGHSNLAAPSAASDD